MYFVVLSEEIKTKETSAVNDLKYTKNGEQQMYHIMILAL